MKQRPVVTGFKVRPVTYPQGHWMNRVWPSLGRMVMTVAGRVPFYRYILRAHTDAVAFLDSDAPAVFACVHQDVFDCFNGLPRIFQDRRFAAMVSYSRDGGLAAMGLRMLGYEVVRGSSSRGGGEALMLLRSSLASGLDVVMTCDGPKAPLGDVKAGVVRLAGSAGVPVLPVRAWGLSRWRFSHSWTRAAVTTPFSPVAVCVGAPIFVPKQTRGSRPYQIAVAEAISHLAAWSSAWAGGPPRAPFSVASD